MDARTGGDWKRIRTGDGSWTLEHPVHGEACHSRHGAWTEARERYCVPCHLPELARRRGAAGLRLLDVGTGLGLNLAAALEACEEEGVPLHAVTLERVPEVIRTAIAVGEGAPSTRGGPDAERERELHARILAALAAALEAPGTAVALEGAPEGTVTLLLGDARETLPALDPTVRFDAVFLDPFSHRKEPELWQAGFLADVAERLDEGGRLSTFSAATRVRAGLAAAGLAVGLGPPVAKKAAGTVAARGAEVPRLDPKIARRVETARRALLGLPDPAEDAPRSPERPSARESDRIIT